MAQNNKGYLWQTHSQHHFHWWERQRRPLLPISFIIVLIVLVTGIRQRKKTKKHPYWKGRGKTVYHAQKCTHFIPCPLHSITCNWLSHKESPLILCMIQWGRNDYSQFTEKKTKVQSGYVTRVGDETLIWTQIWYLDSKERATYTVQYYLYFPGKLGECSDR